jgi:HEPN domain-containing protein
MPAEPPKPDPIVIVAYLDDVDGELEAARRLSKDPPSRFAAFHLQQAAEKLVKAVRLHRGLFASADHNILALVEELPSDDVWRAKLSPLGVLSAYATTFRYPSPAGKRKPGLSSQEVLEWIETIGALVVDVRAFLAMKIPRQ